MRKIGFLTLLLAAAAFCTANRAHAARVFISEVGQPVLANAADTDSQFVAPAPLSPTTVPTITMNVGESKTVHVWIRPDTTAGLVQNFLAVALDIDSSNGGVAHATSYDVYNPEIRVPGDNSDPENPVPTTYGPDRRWDGVVPPTIGGAGSIDWVTNAAGVKVLMQGIGNANTTNTPFRQDPGRDSTNRSFYLGSLTFTADAAGTTGLFFRTGAAKSTLAPSAAGAPMQYGANSDTYLGTQVGLGDPIDNMSLADAVITVLPSGPTRTDLIIRNDPTSPSPVVPGGDFAGPNGDDPAHVHVGRPDGTIIVRNWTRSFFDVFFDVEIAPNSNTDLAGLMSMLRTQLGVDVLPSPRPDELGFGVDYDFHLVIPVLPGQDQRLDFDFSANGVTGVTVNDVGVPEPSSMILAAIGGVALIGFRLRRRAA